MLDQPQLTDATDLQQFQEQYLKQQLQKQHLSGSRSFYWIAGLSIVNSLLILSESDQTFSIGLAITQMIDYISGMLRAAVPNSTAVITIVALILDAIIAFVMISFGWLAVRGQGWAFISGMILYALDCGIFLLAGEWFAAGFHAVVLWIIYRGLKALIKLQHQVPDVSWDSSNP